MSRIPRVAAALAAVAAMLLASAQPAAAHERRTVGPYQFVVGFLEEPVFVNQLNGVDLRVTDTRDGKPVEGVEKALAVEVTAGGRSAPLRLDLKARSGQPGAYAAQFVPTRTGSYTFVFKGTVGTTAVNETFESGPGRFNEPEAPVHYPDSPSDVTARLDDVRATAERTQVIAVVAAALGALALVLALARRRA